jgi:hypothetical protein
VNVLGELFQRLRLSESFTIQGDNSADIVNLVVLLFFIYLFFFYFFLGMFVGVNLRKIS